MKRYESRWQVPPYLTHSLHLTQSKLTKLTTNSPQTHLGNQLRLSTDAIRYCRWDGCHCWSCIRHGSGGGGGGGGARLFLTGLPVRPVQVARQFRVSLGVTVRARVTALGAEGDSEVSSEVRLGDGSYADGTNLGTCRDYV